MRKVKKKFKEVNNLPIQQKLLSMAAGPPSLLKKMRGAHMKGFRESSICS